jgi:uncharacterized repeat protein (TIGR01451 family)
MKLLTSYFVNKARALLQVALGIALGLMWVTVQAVPTAPGSLVTNTATANYNLTNAAGLTNPLQVSATGNVSTAACTPAKIDFLKYVAPAALAQMPPLPAAQAVAQTIPAAQVRNAAGVFVAASGPNVPGVGILAVGTATQYNLVTATGASPLLFNHSEAIFVQVVNYSNVNSATLVDKLLVTLTTVASRDSEVLQLTETGINTSVFTGYIQPAAFVVGVPAVANNNSLSIGANETINASTPDACNGVAATATTVALADPFGVVFDSSNGVAVNGATVTLMDAATGLPAIVYGDDGVSIYPSTVISGSNVTDAKGTVYVMGPGQFRFPFVQAPGTYFFKITPPGGYRAPSIVPVATLIALPNKPVIDGTGCVAGVCNGGSFGSTFKVLPGPAAHIDIPLDIGTNKISITKTAIKQVAGTGDFVPYTLSIVNLDTAASVALQVADHTPIGFRYQKGSTTINGVKVADPLISADARTLTFAVPSIAVGGTALVKYVLQITPGASTGVAENTATALNASSNTGRATILVREDLYRNKSMLIGRVIDGSCDDTVDNDAKGLKGARVVLQDGTQVLTDGEGRWHMDNLRPGTQVVQLDLESLPKNYEVVTCEKNTRFAGRNYSQFVNLQGGTLWRADFHVQKKAAVALRVTQAIGVKSSADESTVLSLAVLSSTEVTSYTSTVILPLGVTFVAGSATLNGEKIADPEIFKQGLTFRSLARPAHWQDEYLFQVENVGPKAIFRSLLRFTPPGRSAINAPMAEVNVRNHAPATNRSYADVLVEPDDLQQAGALEDASLASLVEKLPYDDVWLAKETAGTTWLHPQSNFHPNLPVVSIAVKHDPKEKVSVSVNDIPVSGLKFNGIRFNSDNTVALTSWRSVPIHAGDNRVEVVITDAQGVEHNEVRVIHYGEEIDHVEFVPALSRLIADGKTRPIIAMRFLDKQGGAVRRGINGDFTLSEPYRSYDRHQAAERQPLTSNVGGKARFEVGQDGIALLQLDPTTQSGEAVMHFQFQDRRIQEVRAWLQPQQRDWILVGFAEGSLGKKTMTGNMEALQANVLDAQLYDKNKLAFYAKGSIKGEYLLTAAYDTAKKLDRSALKQAVDPTQYYTLYADATQANFDAATASRLYLKLERKQFYAMFGDYDTGLTVTELARYSRTFNGVKSEYKNDVVGYNAFASSTAQAYVKDEIQGNGTSGMFKLSRANIVVNSDKIRIETRDRFQSQIIVSTRSMTRYLDYDIDYALGTLIFREPIQARDAAFNPTYIVAEFESADAVDARTTLGGRASVKPLDGLELGATAIHEGTVGAAGGLQGLDATYQLSDATKLRTEIAGTNRTRAGLPVTGKAWLTELTHHEEQWDGKAYVREQAGSFGMGQQAAVETATRKMGLDGRYKWDDTINLKGQAYTQNNLTTNSKNTVLEGRVDNQINSILSAYYGGRKSQDTSPLFGNHQSNQLLAGANLSLLENQLSLRAGAEVGTGSLAATAASASMPNRLTLGADYKVTSQSKVFIEQELARGDKVSANTLRAGLRAQPWQGAEMAASVGDAFNNDAERLYGNLGVVQRWQISEHWQTDFSVDRSVTLRSKVSPAQVSNQPLPSGSAAGSLSDYTAMAVGGGYQDTVWSANGKLELRNSSLSQQRNIKFGTQRSLDEGRSMAAGITVLNSTGLTTSNNADLRLSYAHRPNDSEWVWFDRADFITQLTRSPTSNLRTKKLVNNLNANWMLNRRTEWAFQYGAKYVLDNIEGLDYKGYTDLLGTELRYDLNEDFDIGGFGSMMRSVTAGVRSYGIGASLGYNLMENTWLAVGYNLRGMGDRDFAGANYRNKGPFVTLRMKIDQDTLGLNNHGERTRPLAAE